MVHKLLHFVLVYAFQEEANGCSLWADTAGAIHAYVSEGNILFVATYNKALVPSPLSLQKGELWR